MKPKSLARQSLLQKRTQLSLHQVRLTSQQITQKLLQTIDFAQFSRIHLYTPLAGGNEVDTTMLQYELTIRYPELQVIMGNPRPQAAFPKGDFDAVFTPCVGFNRDGFRLGFGNGWYDRFLLGQPQALKIGLAYAWSKVDFVPEPHDIPLDMILTDG